MARVLSSSEIKEICDLLIPIIRDERSVHALTASRVRMTVASHGQRARAVWKLITYEDYAGELI
jgi:hypothetical protein